MALTEEEKVKIRHHLGYMNVSAVSTFVLGTPAAVETQFIIEGAMVRLMIQAEGECRRQLGILDDIEDQMNSDRELLAVTKVDEIDIRATEMKELRDEYQHWRLALANLFGIHPNPFDQRFTNTGLNVAVHH